MKIAVIGATGTIGSLVTGLLLDRGHAVTAIARNPGSVPDHPGLTRAQADIFKFDQLREALAGHESLVVAFAPKDNSYPGYMQLVEAAWRIKRAFKEVIPEAYFLNVGGASSLWTPRGFQMFEDPGWPHWFFNAAGPEHWARLYKLSGGMPAFKEMAAQREAILADPTKDRYANFTGEVIEGWYSEIDKIFGKGMGGRAQLEFFDCDRSFRWSFVSPPWLLGQPEVTGTYRTTIDTLPVEDGQPAGISVQDLALAITDTVEANGRVHQHWSAARALPEGVAG
ncbi:NAD(P)-dependent oxidoreductase [Frigidibacter sp.]|uniref:NAD(P)-dependent oxidoreductase n=1 Tax=Frigidibacter sp. TaxID=2586418 RepID=UPI0027351F8B|nr:NAD(P)H-binding protein [Frigidibacter sp.]MDP3342196.1 NAD(P)H-binding protein [Frigidibacter sp.]